MKMPGFVEQGTVSPFHFRLFIYGEPKVGKTAFCGSFPKPLLLHPKSESGYDTFRQPDGTNLFPKVELGLEQHLWLREKVGKESHRCVSQEIRTWTENLSVQLERGECPYQTIVIGGFNVIQDMILAEGNKISPGDGQKAWGYVAKWAADFLQSLCNFPAHVIIECGAAVVDKDRSTGRASKWAPAIAGKTYNSVLAATNLILWQEKDLAGRFMTYVSINPNSVNGSRLYTLTQMPQPVPNACYDTFAQYLGLPPIYVADPQHPRVIYDGQPQWPWVHTTF